MFISILWQKFSCSVTSHYLDLNSAKKFYRKLQVEHNNRETETLQKQRLSLKTEDLNN